MATAQEVINRAGSYIRIVSSPGAAVDATTSADMLTHLGDLISIWSEKGLTEIPAPATLGTTLDESPGMISCIAMNLALIYGQVIGKQPDLWLVSQAKEYMRYYMARKTVVAKLSLHKDGFPGLSPGKYNIANDS